MQRVQDTYSGLHHQLSLIETYLNGRTRAMTTAMWSELTSSHTCSRAELSTCGNSRTTSWARDMPVSHELIVHAITGLDLFSPPLCVPNTSAMHCRWEGAELATDCWLEGQQLRLPWHVRLLDMLRSDDCLAYDLVLTSNMLVVYESVRHINRGSEILCECRHYSNTIGTASDEE